MLASHWGDEKKIFFFFFSCKRKPWTCLSFIFSLSFKSRLFLLRSRCLWLFDLFGKSDGVLHTHTHTHPFSAKEHCRSSSSLFTSPFGPVPKDLNSFIMAALRVMFIPFSLGSSLCELLPFFFFFSWMFLFLSLSLSESVYCLSWI